jgi:hypothetical protein
MKKFNWKESHKQPQKVIKFTKFIILIYLYLFKILNLQKIVFKIFKKHAKFIILYKTQPGKMMIYIFKVKKQKIHYEKKFSEEFNC